MGKAAHRIEDVGERCLLSAEACGHQKLGETGRDQVAHGVVGEAAEFFGLGGALTECGDEPIGDAGLRFSTCAGPYHTF